MTPAKVLTIGSLFSGIGGLDYGVEQALGGSVIWQVEQDGFCRQVLEKHWPNVDRSVTDVRAAGSTNLRRVDVICGGFPCQDVSGAGAGAGLSGERSGLWYEYLRIVRDLRPRAVVVENVASGARRWLPHVRSMLRAAGYRTRAIAISAADVGAPHLRRRIFVLGLADTEGAGCELLRGAAESDRGREAVANANGVWEFQSAERRNRKRDGIGVCHQNVADADGPELREQQGRSRWPGGTDEILTRHHGENDVADAHGERCKRGAARTSRPVLAAASRSIASGWEPESSVGRVLDGLPTQLDAHRWPAPPGAPHFWEPPRTIPKGSDSMRRPRLKALGNSVVPQCAYAAGLVLKEWMAEAALENAS